VLCDGIGFNPAGGVNPLNNVGSTKNITPAPGTGAISKIDEIIASIGPKTQSTLAGDGARSILQDIA
jgi:hypothetical protein